MNMNKATISISLFAILVCIASFAYLNNRQQKTALRIENDIFEQFHLWTKSYDSIKDELESKKQVKNFLAQEEYARGLEDFVKAQLGNFTKEQQGFRQEFLGLLQQQKDAYDKFSIDIDGQINEQKESFLEYETKTEKILEEYSLGMKQELAGLKQELAENKIQLADYKKRLAESENRVQEYNKLLETYRQEQLEYEKRLSAYANLTQSIE